MNRSVSDNLDGIPRRNLKAELCAGEGERQKTSPAGALVDLARKRCGLEVKEMAFLMDISESVLLRGFKDQESISWQRLQRLPDRFQRALLEVQGEDLSGVEIVTEIRVRKDRRSA